jgi:hypothetical protein
VPREPYVFFTDRDLGTRFANILTDAGLSVRRHSDLFPPDCPDDIWLEAIGREGWVAISHDTRIRYKSNELAAVVRYGVRLLVVIGKAAFPDLARNFVATALRVNAFIDTHPAPWIAKVYRPTVTDTTKGPDPPGSVSLWYPRK